MKKEVKYDIAPLEEVDGLKKNEKYIRLLLLKKDDNRIFYGYIFKGIIEKYL